MRSSRSQLRALARHWPTGQPSVTVLLLASSLLAAATQWAYMLLTEEGSAWSGGSLIDWLGLQSNTFSAGHWWQMDTFLLVHANLPHLILNLLVLYFAGREVEPIVGSRHFFGLYLLGNVGGGLLQWAAWQSGWNPGAVPLVGVSGGVAAVLAAYATILPELETVVMLFLVIPMRVRAKALGMGTAVLGALLWVGGCTWPVGPISILAGCGIGWGYARLLGFGQPMALECYLYERRQRLARLERMPAEQFIREELDPILEKIAGQGLRSLTRGERKLLEKGRAKLAGKARK